MNQLLKKLWNDQGGFILSTEAMILWTIVVLGMVTGLVAVRDASVTELTEVANTILTFNQSYNYDSIGLDGTNALVFPGGLNENAWTSGSNAQDITGFTGRGDVATTQSAYSIIANGTGTVTPLLNTQYIMVPTP